MKNGTREPITYARFINLMEAFSALEDLLCCFLDEEITKNNHNLEVLESIIPEQIKMCALHRREIRAHLEECREWDAFPEEFWNENNAEYITSSTGRYPCGSDLITKLAFVTEGFQRAAKIAGNCLRDYQHSGYISHQPVAIDLLDTLIEINSDFTYLNDNLLNLSLQNEDDRFPLDPVDRDGFMPDSQKQELNEMEWSEIERLRLQMEQQRRYMQRRNIHRR